MNKNQRGNSNLGILEWIIIGCVLLGFLGLGPCGGACGGCTPQQYRLDKKDK